MSNCPLPISDYPTIQLAHGGGGRLMHRLIQELFMMGFDDDMLSEHRDSAVLSMDPGRLAFTTDSYVVQPRFFPGGDIGKLAICGTVNDLAMSGARPVYLSAGFILEEGLPTETLWEVVQSMQRAASEAGVRLVAGDTKVVDRGKGDGIYINTSGIGVIEHDLSIGPDAIRPGDAVLLSGDLGRHGIAVMAQREGLTFETIIESDCGLLSGVVDALLKSGVTIRCMRDLTRGGLTSALVEIAESAGLNIHIRSRSIPVQEGVRGACELLGLDPLYVANEGRMAVIVPERDARQALECMQAISISTGAVEIGRVEERKDCRVTIESEIGVTRILDMLSGEQLPRIC